MQKHSVTTEKRSVQGRKVKTLRSQGITPANIFGKGIKSQLVQLNAKTFAHLYREVGETGIIELIVEGEKEKRPVLITNVQHHPVTDMILHVDFHQVDLKEKVTARIPLVIKGESPAVLQKLGALFTPTDDVEVEALPMDLPEEIGVDVSVLSALNQEIKIKDLSIDKAKVTILADPELVVAKIGPLVSKEAEELAKEQAAQAAEAAATEAPAGVAAETIEATTPVKSEPEGEKKE